VIWDAGKILQVQSILLNLQDSERTGKADENEVSGTFSLNAPYSPKGTWVATRN
jgi:hypothetical protein